MCTASVHLQGPLVLLPQLEDPGNVTLDAVDGVGCSANIALLAQAPCYSADLLIWRHGDDGQVRRAFFVKLHSTALMSDCTKQ